MGSYRSLKAWQVSHRLAQAVAHATDAFPKAERFELTSQLRRASLSAPTNLAEGYTRFGRRDFLWFVRIAGASLGEVDYLLQVSAERGYLGDAQYRWLERLRREASYLVHRLALSLDQERS
jgi:four helix bundle protein